MHTPNQTTPGPDGQSRGNRPTEELQSKAQQAAEQAKNQGKAKLDEYRQSGAAELENAAEGARAAAAELDRRGDALLSQYVSDFAGGMVRLADNLRGKSADELIQEASRLARNNPTLFVVGSIAAGFGLARFARASSSRAAEAGHEDTRGQSSAATGVTPGSLGTGSGALDRKPGASAYASATSDFSNASSHMPGRGDGHTTSGGHH